jgi:hypothetical protein
MDCSPGNLRFGVAGLGACGSRGGRPVSYDRNLYKGRNVFERAFNLLKQW